ncbi:MAG: hypothetical protein OHK0029_02420 [Armatimonadaceae bacterium]
MGKQRSTKVYWDSWYNVKEFEPVREVPVAGEVADTWKKTIAW